MRCENFESRLNDVLDARQPLSSASDLREHVRECTQCRELARAYESVLTGLEQAEIPAEPAWLTRRVLSQLEEAAQLPDERRGNPPRPSESPAQRVSHSPRRRALALAAAAVIMAAIGLPWIFRRGDDLAKGTLAKENQPAEATAGERGSLVVKTHRASQNDKAIHAEVVDRKALATERRRRRGAPGMTQGPLAITLDPSQLKADDLINSLPGTEWAHDVADGLEPVTKPTVGAINGFLQLWGIGDEGRRS